MRARQAIHTWPGGYVGIDWYPYQLAFGVSVRWLERRPHLRLYLGPIKIYTGGLPG